MKKLTRLAVLMSLISGALGIQQAHAGASRFYVGADIGAVQFSGDGPVQDSVFIPGQEFRASDTTYGLRAGFQFNEWFALELGYSDFGSGTDHFKVRDDIVFIVQPNDTQRLDAKGASLAGVFSYGLSPRFSLLGVLGVSAIEYDVIKSGGFSSITGSLVEQDSFSDQGLVFGVGAKYALSDSLSLRTELRRNDVGDFTLDVVNLGLEYTF